MLRAAANWSRQEIALEFGIDIKTLAKYYQLELETGWIRWKGKALDLLAKSAKGGNVSAQGKLVALINESNPGWTPNSGPQNTPTANPTGAEEDSTVQEPLGKKAQAEAAAQTAGIGTEWGQDLVPGSKAN